MTLLLLAPLLAVGLVSVIEVRTQSTGGAGLIARQHDAGVLTPGAVARVVRAAPDPVTRAGGKKAVCAALGSGGLQNPWRCTIGYPSGRLIQYRVTVGAGGSYSGDQEIVRYRGRTYRDTGRITGCCIEIP